MTTGEFDFIIAWLDSALPAPEQQANKTAVTLNESLLKALALVDQDKAPQADAVFKEALEQIGASKQIAFELLPTIADLCFGYGRLLLKLKQEIEGNALIDIALRLYTRLYGIEDGRTIFCADKKRELAKTVNNEVEVAKVRYFLRAHTVLNKLKSMRLLPDAGPTDFHTPIEKSTDSFSAGLSGLPSESPEQQITEVEDQHVVQIVTELFAACERAEGHAGKLVVIPAQDTADTVQARIEDFAKYVEPFIKAIANPILRKEVSGMDQEKWSGSGVDEVCGLVNKRLKQLNSVEQFYPLGNQSAEHSYVYLFCSQDQVGRLKECLPIGGKAKKK